MNTYLVMKNTLKTQNHRLIQPEILPIV